MTRRDEFQKLSQRQQDIITQVLHAQKLLSANIVASIKSSEANVTSHLDRQDVQLANSLQLLSTEVPGAIKQSEAIVVQRLDAQDAHFEREAAAQQGASAQWRHQEEQDVLRRRLLDALAFPEMNERRNMIESRVTDFGSTYTWIFGCNEAYISAYNEDYILDSETGGNTESDHDAESRHSDGNHSWTAEVVVTANANDAQDEVVLAGAVVSDTNPSTVYDSDTRVQRISKDEGDNGSLGGLLGSAKDGTLLRHYNRGYLDFVHWLQSDEDVFWISGKPGSGKSTLMDFVFHNLGKGGLGYDALQAWAGTTEVQLLSFWFFRPATSILLKSMQGFWRTLCFQILDCDANILETVRADDDGAAPKALRSCIMADGSRAKSWTDKELRSWLYYLLGRSGLKYCILVDGLDEVEREREQLLQTITFLASAFPNVKVLCSSRPDLPFGSALRKYPSLRVQDFNYEDIASDCRRRLADTCARFLIDEIVDRAEGVFLWAHMIAEDLRLAAGRGDDEVELKQRLQECPTEMNELFEHMLLRQDRFDTKHPKPYLRLMDFALMNLKEEPTLLDILIASQDHDELDSVIFERRWDDYASLLNRRAAGFEISVVARCAGLVERYDSSSYIRTEFAEDYPHAALEDLDGSTFHFIHRSAHDFLRESSKEVSARLIGAFSNDDVASRLVDAAIIRFCMNHDELKPSWVIYTLRCASSIAPTGWESRTTRHLDILFSELCTRVEGGTLMFDASTDIGRYLDEAGVMVTSSRLPARDNLTYTMAAGHNLFPYIRSTIETLDIDQLTIVLALLLCNTLRKDLEASEEFARYFNKPLNTMLTISLEYRVFTHRYPCSTIVSTRYVWEHLGIAVAAAVWNDPPAKYCHPERLSRLCHSMNAGEADKERHIECLLIVGNFYYDPEILSLVPMPDDLSVEQLQQCPEESIVLHIRLAERVARPHYEDSYATPQFLRLRIGGTTRLLNLSSTQSDELQQAWSTAARVDSIFSWYQHNIAELWNACLTQVSPQETIQLLCCHGDVFGSFLGHQVFRDGRLQEADAGEWRAWRDELKSNRFTQTEPVLVGYLDAIDQRREKQETGMEEARRRREKEDAER